MADKNAERNVIALPFRMTLRMGSIPWKIRDDGREGRGVGDEMLLWDVLQESLSVQKQQVELIEKLTGELAASERELAAMRDRIITGPPADLKARAKR